MVFPPDKTPCRGPSEARECDKVFCGRKHHYVPKKVNINIITIPPPPPHYIPHVKNDGKNNKSIAIIKNN